ncbi:glycosyltransferase [Qipengyuania sp. G39]|uniref:Glycosyltransferase n=1 Tax=Qipengyuania profundimaris TaxID=3067652 RepID=A0ABT9HR80_9SPHN|nr:glycosyltransferase [Qipengyuania sp. G39]MDP4575664.1 glycosyltransferase [Qipengyuania sp. G39]
MTEIAAPSPAGGSAPLSRKYWDQRDRKSALRFTVSIALAMAWVVFSIWLSLPWLSDLGDLSHPIVALFVLAFVAYVPGFMNAFLLFSLVFRPDPLRRTPAHWPSLSILIAAYNEEALIGETLRSLSELEYPGKLQIMVLDDGSTDGTADAVRAQEALFAGHPRMELQLVSERKNRGKARVLNHGLKLASHDLIVTIDADTLLEKGCLVSLVEHLHASPPETKAIAGSVLVANHDESWVTRAQQWDYFHGIAAVKRMQGMYNGTLVAQGAFSIYRKDALIEAGGWPDTVGEDIVLTWSLLRKGYKTGHAEDAVAWTHAPETFKGLAKQRKRWARGMIEALAIHKPLLKMRKLRTMFIWWNLLFVSIDLTFTFAFIPGLILALLGIFWLAGPITLLVLPLAALWNIVIYRIQTRMLKRNDIEMEKSLPGFLLYAFIYPLLMQPVSVWGYFAELFGGRKQWN